MFAFQMIGEIKIGAEVTQAYPFEIPMNNPEVVKVTHTGHSPRQLRTIKDA